MMDIAINNLIDQMQGRSMTTMQKGDALIEFNKLIEHCDYLEAKLKSNDIQPKCVGCMGNGKNLLSTPGIGEVRWEKCRKSNSC